MEAISILFKCNFVMGLLCSTVIAGNVQAEVEKVDMVDIQAQNSITAEQVMEEKRETAEKEAEARIAAEKAKEKESAVSETTNETVSVFSEVFDSSFKAYMDYRCITDTNSRQYELQQQAYTDERGFRRIGDDYCIALGTGFTNGCGERFLIHLDSGYSFTAIVSDVKSDSHTDATHCFVPSGENSGNVVEFIIDKNAADSAMLSSGNAGYYADLSGNVTVIERI